MSAVRGRVFRMSSQPSSQRVLMAAGSFTGLWALTWLGAAGAGAQGAVQGGFAVGGVMASSGLTVLWWKTRALRALQRQEAEAAAEAERADVVADPLP